MRASYLLWCLCSLGDAYARRLPSLPDAMHLNRSGREAKQTIFTLRARENWSRLSRHQAQLFMELFASQKYSAHQKRIQEHNWNENLAQLYLICLLS